MRKPGTVRCRGQKAVQWLAAGLAFNPQIRWWQTKYVGLEAKARSVVELGRDWRQA